MFRPSDDPFLRLDSPRYDDIVADGLVQHLRGAGIDSWSMAALARWMKVTPGAVTQRAGRPETMLLLVHAMGRRVRSWSERGLRVGGVPPLPVTDTERHGLRVWALLAEFARSELAVGRAAAVELLADLHDRERVMVQQWWERDTDPADRISWDEFWALLCCLRVGLATDPTLSAAAAQCLLDRAAERRTCRGI